MAVTKAAVDGNLWQNETPNCRHQTLIGVHTVGWCVKATKMIQMYDRHLKLSTGDLHGESSSQDLLLEQPRTLEAFRSATEAINTSHQLDVLVKS